MEVIKNTTFQLYISKIMPARPKNTWQHMAPLVSVIVSTVMAIHNLVIANEDQGHIPQRPGCCQSTGNMCDSVKNQLWRSACIVVYLDLY